MKVYLAGSISGGREFESGMQAIGKALGKLGYEVLSPFILDTKVNDARFAKLKGLARAKAIHDEDLELIRSADVFIAEISSPSHGVGVEAGYSYRMNEKGRKLPMLFLKHKSTKDKRASFLLAGSHWVVVELYDERNVKRVLKKFFENL